MNKYIIILFLIILYIYILCNYNPKLTNIDKLKAKTFNGVIGYKSMGEYIDIYNERLKSLTNKNIIITNVIATPHVFRGTYISNKGNKIKVVIKFLSHIGIMNNEPSKQAEAYLLGLSPKVYRMSEPKLDNEVLIMKFLSDRDGWVPYYIYKTIPNKHLHHNNINSKKKLKGVICNAIRKLTKNNIVHGDLQDINIMINYKTGIINLIDYEDATYLTDEKKKDFLMPKSNENTSFYMDYCEK